MKKPLNRRTFLHYSGLGLAAASTGGLLSACGDNFDTAEHPQFGKENRYWLA